MVGGGKSMVKALCCKNAGHGKTMQNHGLWKQNILEKSRLHSISTVFRINTHIIKASRILLLVPCILYDL